MSLPFVAQPAKPPDYDRRLARLNSNVRVEWNSGLSVWEIQELGRVTKSWRYVMLWAVLNPPSPPKFLPIPSPEEVLRRLHEIDSEKLGSTPSAQWGALCADMDEKRRDYLAGHLAEMDVAGKEYAEDMHKRVAGIRQTFGPGSQYGRTRHGLGRDGGSPNMRKFMAEKTIKPRIQPISPYARIR
jgi:hypothetical protein